MAKKKKPRKDSPDEMLQKIKKLVTQRKTK